MKAQDVVARAMPTMRILWLALTVSTVLLAVVGFFVQPQVRHAPDTTMVAFFGVLALVLAVTSFVLPARNYAVVAKRNPPEVYRPERTPAAFQPPPARFASPVKAARKAVGVAQLAFILSMALSEAVSLLAALRFPTPARLLVPYERLHGATFEALP